MKLVRPIRRIETAKGHAYRDAERTSVRGVTTWIDKGKPKPALINWAANTTAEGALDRWDELGELPPAQRLATLKGIRYAEKDLAANRGTEVHRIGEALVRGEAVDVPTELYGHATAYSKLLDEFKVEPVHVEFSVGHYAATYAGTGDLIAWFTLPRIGRKLLLVDLKTNRSGIFAETALQLAAYRYAEVMLEDDEHPERPMPEVDGTAAIHITPSGAELIPVTTNTDVFNAFRYVQQVAKFEDAGRDLIGGAIRPESEVRYVLERVEADA